jgi:F-type H+-transporting ATPase subunit b
MMSNKIRISLLAPALLVTALLSTSTLLFAQSTSQPQQPPASVTQAPNLEQLNRQAERDLRKASEQAGVGHPPENTEEAEENAQFKYNSSVKAVAGKTGLPQETVYWAFLVINFAILFGVGYWIVRKALPNGFAPRNAEIRKGIEEARKASAEANARLSEIEHRLARLDTEIAAIRTAAEADFSIEEQRIKAAAEQDARNVIAAAEQEINAATRVAQRELKSFVADLAVGLAEKKIKVDDATDQSLVRAFASQLGKDGQ